MMFLFQFKPNNGLMVNLFGALSEPQNTTLKRHYMLHNNTVAKTCLTWACVPVSRQSRCVLPAHLIQFAKASYDQGDFAFALRLNAKTLTQGIRPVKSHCICSEHRPHQDNIN